MTHAPAIERLRAALEDAVRHGRFVKLTLKASPGGALPWQNVFARPVQLKPGPKLSLVYRHATKEITRNFDPAAGVEELGKLLNAALHSAHLFTTEAEWELRLPAGRPASLRRLPARHAAPASLAHDRAKSRRLVAESAPWLAGLEITAADGRLRPGGAAKFTQINRFLEILDHSLNRAGLLPARNHSAAAPSARGLTLVDMGCGKGYLTFAAYDWLRRTTPAARVIGVEVRTELVEGANRLAREHGLSGLEFRPGAIAEADVTGADVLAALHACDTATDDALAKGIAAGARLMLVAPCCHKEVRPQLRPPPALAGTLRHGIWRERQAEFVTDALRAALLEWAGYDVRVFEFVAPDHTAKNLMIAATRRRQPGATAEAAEEVRRLAAFFGVRSQHLAARLNFPFAPATASPAIP